MEKLLSIIVGVILIAVSVLGQNQGSITEPVPGSEISEAGTGGTAAVQDPVMQEKGILRSMEVSSPPAAELDYTPLSEIEYRKVVEIFREQYKIPEQFQEKWGAFYRSEEIKAEGRYGDMIFISMMTDIGISRVVTVGSLFFTYTDKLILDPRTTLQSMVFLYTGEELLTLPYAYEAGLIPYQVLKAFHETWYAVNPELEALYCSDYAEAFIKTLLCNEHAELERIQNGHIKPRIPSGPALPAALSDSWAPETLADSYPSDSLYDSDTNLPGNRIQITSPDYPGYTVSVFLQNGYSYHTPGVVLQTPEGCVSFKDKRFADLYVALMDQYDAASAAAGLEVPEELTADYVLKADVDQRGGDETILVTAGEDSIHVEVVDRAGMDFLFTGSYYGRVPGIDITSGALILSEMDGEWYLLQYRETDDPFVQIYPGGATRTFTVKEVYGPHAIMENGQIMPFVDQLAIVSHYLHNKGFKSEKTYKQLAIGLIEDIYNIKPRQIEDVNLASEGNYNQYSLFKDFFAVPFPE